MWPVQWRGNDVREVASLMEEERSCYRGGHSWRENGHGTDV